MTDRPAPASDALGPEDAKLVTLARATRARVGAAQGAAVRDEMGRTYAAATVDLPSLQLSAVQVCVAMAVASGSRGIAACALLGEVDALGDDDRGALADLAVAGGVAVHLGDARGTVGASLTVDAR
ncbi:cytidine deaminase [Nocardioides nanhaiensis]|uniref:Cytidine deaminase n=1 Tax=Nocardioides nanhaiensis TaxID=1476871 RepID=A0ABP8WTB0_9ACTN